MNLFGNLQGQNEPALTTAAVGCFVHRIDGWVVFFHLALDPAVTNVVPQSTFFWLMTFDPFCFILFCFHPPFYEHMSHSFGNKEHIG
jgi:hypothetical protein